jgi:DNA polymerase
MEDAHPATVPDTTSITKLRAAAADCAACPLYKNATQTVFGEGPRHASIFIVGEQPGDREDIEGRPFVGPAGKLLDRALLEAGIERAAVYVTNAVKHFKSVPRGKRRLHQKPNSREIAACRPWLHAELRSIKPRFLILLGATAAQTVFGSTARVQRDRGRLRKSEQCERTLITIHPSALLRAPDESSRQAGFHDFVRDLRVVAKALKRAPDKGNAD